MSMHAFRPGGCVVRHQRWHDGSHYTFGVVTCTTRNAVSVQLYREWPMLTVSARRDGPELAGPPEVFTWLATEQAVGRCVAHPGASDHLEPWDPLRNYDAVAGA